MLAPQYVLYFSHFGGNLGTHGHVHGVLCKPLSPEQFSHLVSNNFNHQATGWPTFDTEMKIWPWCCNLKYFQTYQVSNACPGVEDVYLPRKKHNLIFTFWRCYFYFLKNNLMKDLGHHIHSMIDKNVRVKHSHHVQIKWYKLEGRIWWANFDT